MIPVAGRSVTSEAVDPDARPPFDELSRRRQVDAVLGWTVRSLAEEIREVEGGWIARCPSLPLVHSLNRLQVTHRAEPADVIRMADVHMADLPYRHVEVDDAATAVALEQVLVTDGSGWKLDREVYMVLDDPRPSGAAAMRSDGSEADDRLGVVQLTHEETDEVMRRWLAEEHFDTTPGALDQLSLVNRREGELWGEVALGVREAGRAVALTKSRSHGEVGWVEDVYTVPEARRKGYARLLVGHAVQLAREADHELTFIIADDNDWPKHLYSALGFSPVGFTWTFHLDLTT